MKRSETIYLHVWTGATERARAVVKERFPGAEVVELSHRELRDGGWKGQIRSLHALHGRALVVFFERLEEAPQLQLVLWSGLVHRCRETAIADESGQFRVYRRSAWGWLFPRAVASAVNDAIVLAFSYLLLRLWKALARPQPLENASGVLDLAYLFPYPLVKDFSGGAASHIRGVLGGVVANGASCEIFAGAPLPMDVFPVRIIPAKRRLFLFWETMMLCYSLRFAREARRLLATNRPSLLYARHGRFTVAGPLLSAWMRVPFILEYNASELWMANYWDPTRFCTWLRFCEEVSLRTAARIVVVSEPIRQELLERGIPAERIILSPNAVDPEFFHPGCGGEEVRRRMGFAGDQTVAAFAGSFSYWHGIPVLHKAIEALLAAYPDSRFRFILIGDGPLRAEMRRSLRMFEERGQIVFTGIVPHHDVRGYLDAADILVSPHIPLPDGKPFFGSPTKLFEYMSMGKAIAASRLDQLAEVLSHNETALLVTPGDVSELVSAMWRLATDVDLRRRLGQNARKAAIEQHTWQQNAARVLQLIPHAGNATTVPAQVQARIRPEDVRRKEKQTVPSA